MAPIYVFHLIFIKTSQGNDALFRNNILYERSQKKYVQQIKLKWILLKYDCYILEPSDYKVIQLLNRNTLSIGIVIGMIYFRS